MSVAAEVELGSGQRRLWFLEQLRPGSAAYNVAARYRFHCDVDRSALAWALEQIVMRHRPLRTAVRNASGRPEPHLVEPAVDLDDLRPAAEPSEVRKALQEPFDIEAGPLIRARIVPRDDQGDDVIVVSHHMAVDGWSFEIIASELRGLYEARVSGAPSPLPSLPMKYADFVSWERAIDEAGQFGPALRYWSAMLEGAPTQIELPGDRPRRSTPRHRGATVQMTLAPGLVLRLQELARQRRCSLFMVTLAAYAAMVSHWVSRDDVLVGVISAGRPRVEFAQTVGFFAQTLPIRIRSAADLSFDELLGRTREVVFGAMQHQHAPFERIVSALNVPRDPSRNPLVQLSFQLLQFQGLPVGPTRGHVLPWDMEDTSSTRLDSELYLVVGAGGGIDCRLIYDTDLFDERTARRWVDQYVTFLTLSTQAPGSSLADLLVDVEQTARGGQDIAGAVPMGSPRSLLDLLDAEVARHPRRAAVVGGRTLDFATLAQRVSAAARALGRLNVRQGSTVAVDLARDVDLVVVLLAVWKVGARFLALDPEHPVHRRRHLIASSDCAVVIVDVAGDRAATPQRVAVTELLDSGEPTVMAGPEPRTGAYVIYTSGSTGKPKGVVVQHDSLVHLARGLHDLLGSPRGWHVSMTASVAFDAFMKQLALLCMGACLHVLPRDVARSPHVFVEYLRSNRLDLLDCTPTQLRLLCEYGLLDGPRAPGRLLIGGEPIDPDLWHRVGSAEHTQCTNVYGPTECAVVSTAARVAASAAPSIGLPLTGVRAYVVDRLGNPVPDGIPGELLIGGLGVARGYVREPALTAASFLPDPHGDHAGARRYRTGDIVCRRAEDGHLEYRGRRDRQVKVRGHRIAPEEVEAVLLEHPRIREAAVVSETSLAAYETTLAAYVSVARGQSVSRREMLDWARHRLPAHMIPHRFEVLDNLPRTPSNKVDFGALARGNPTRAPARSTSEDRTAASSAPPDQDGIDALVRRAWTDVLGTEPSGPEDNFFDSGGDSLRAVRLAARLSSEAGRLVSVGAVYRHKTVALISRHLEALESPTADMPSDWPID